MMRMTWASNTPRMTRREKRLAALREAVDLGVAQAESGQVVQGTPAELMARIHERHGLSRTK